MLELLGQVVVLFIGNLRVVHHHEDTALVSRVQIAGILRSHALAAVVVSLVKSCCGCLVV